MQDKDKSRVQLLDELKSLRDQVAELKKVEAGRKQSEEALRKNETRFRALFERTNDAAFLINLEGKYFAVNQQAADMLGYTVDELKGKSFKALVAPNEYADGKKKLKALLEGKSLPVYERTLRKKNSVQFPVEINAALVYDAEGNPSYIQSIVRDITERKRAEEALRQSKSKYQQLVERVPDGIYQSTPDGKLLAANRALVKMLGYENEDELLKIDIPTELYFSPDEREKIHRKDKQKPKTYKIRRKDGSELWVEDHSHTEGTTKHKPILYEGVLRDVTERKKVEAERLKTLSLLRATLDSTADGILVVNREGEMVSFNEQFTKMWRIPDSILKTKDDAQALNFVLEQLEEPAKFLNKVKELYAKPRSESYDVLEFKDGRIFERYSRPQKIGNKVVGRVWSFRDVTERREAEQALRASEERYRRFFQEDLSGDFISTPDGQLIDCNMAFALISGFESIEEVIKVNMYDLYPNHHDRDVYLKLLKEKRKIQNYEEVLIRRDGKKLHVIENVRGVFDENDELVEIKGYLFDITERKRLEEELSRAQRLESAGRVAGQIAHDFNNLLAPLTAYPAMIKESIPENHSIAEMLEDMESAAHRIAEINQQLLALGRRGHYAMTPVDLNDLINKVLSACPLPNEIVAEKKLAEGLFPIKAGSAQLTRALTNIIVNANEAMSGIGVINVQTENVYLDEPLQSYKTVARGEYVKLTISDTGTGIEQEILNRIFEPFFTTKSMDRLRGSGLGLSVVHGIIEDHKGYIVVESTVGIGTTFALYFPITREGAPESESPSLRSKGGDERILLVDDDPIQRKVGRRLLGDLGYEVQTATSGEEAIELTKKQKYDLLILDMVMEGLDGAEAYRQILEIEPRQKAVVLSGYAMSHRVREALRLGAGGFVSKPISIESLAVAVRNELDSEGDQKTHYVES